MSMGSSQSIGIIKGLFWVHGKVVAAPFSLFSSADLPPSGKVSGRLTQVIRGRSRSTASPRVLPFYTSGALPGPHCQPAAPGGAAVEVRLHRLALQVGEAQVHLAILFHGRSPCLVVVEALIPLSCIFTNMIDGGATHRLLRP